MKPLNNPNRAIALQGRCTSAIQPAVPGTQREVMMIPRAGFLPQMDLELARCVLDAEPPCRLEQQRIEQVAGIGELDDTRVESRTNRQHEDRHLGAAVKNPFERVAMKPHSALDFQHVVANGVNRYPPIANVRRA